MTASTDAAVPAADDAALTPATMVVGAKVTDCDGETVGTVAEVMLAAAAGKIVYVAVCVGGVAGIGERMFAVPWSCFVVDPVGGALSLRFARSTFDGHGGFDKDTWPVEADARLGAC